MAESESRNLIHYSVFHWKPVQLKKRGVVRRMTQNVKRYSLAPEQVDHVAHIIVK